MLSKSAMIANRRAARREGRARPKSAFADLSPDARVALAAYAVLLISEPPEGPELAGLPCGLSRAFGDICKTVGLRGRKQHNNMRRNDLGNARSITGKKFTPVENRRPAKRKVTA